MKRKGKSNRKRLLLSLIVPVFNEEKRVHYLKNVFDYLKKQTFNWEILVVNDGSTDNTLKQLKKMQKDIPFEIISYKNNQGKGAAVRKGMMEAKGKYRLFMDVDLSTPISEIEKVLPWLSKYPVVVGNRKSPKSEVLVKQSKLRQFLGKGYIYLSQIMLGVKVSDFNCGFKCFSEEASRSIFDKQLINGWGFDSEILYLAKKGGFKIKEVPVIWVNDKNSKVRFPGALIDSFMDIVRIKINSHCLKAYD